MNTQLKYLLGAATAALLASCGAPDSGSNEANSSSSASAIVKLEEVPKGQLPEGVTPTTYKLDLTLYPERDTFEGDLSIDLQLDAPHARIWLHSLSHTINSVSAILSDGAEIGGTFTGDLAEGGVSKIDFSETIPAGAATLKINYSAPYDRTLAGLYRADQGGKAYLASQMEPIDARRLLPSFDEPRFKTPFTVSITGPEDIQTVTNGALISTERTGDRELKRSFATTQPLPTYLLGFAVGPYEVREGAAIPANAIRSDPIPFRGLAPIGKGEKLTEAMDATYKMLNYQETYFGTPYPYGKLDIAAVPEFAFGAMENAGIIIYRETALLIDERTSLARKRGILSVHAHELAHQWFGNLVTPKWWDDIWLNESFATWFAYKTMHDFDPSGGFDRTATRRALGAMGADSLKNARQIRNPITRNSDIEDAFDGITYSKGGGVLTMFENYLGEENFREGVRLHMQRFPHGVADVNDFMSSLADGSGDEGVVESFKSFIFQPGIPYLNVQIVCNSTDGHHLRISQSRYAPVGSEIDTSQLWQVPFSANWIAEDGTTKTVNHILTDKESTLPLDTETCPEWVMPNTNGKGYWRFTTSAENWAGLTEAYASLPAGEQLVFVDSLAAAFDAGDLSADTLLAGLQASTTGEWDSAQLGVGRLGRYLDILGADDQSLMRDYIRTTYTPAWEYYGDRTAAQLSPGERLLQDSLFDVMVNFAQDQNMRDTLLESAYEYVGLNGEPNESALVPSQLGTAMTVAAQTGGRDFLDAALAKAYSSTNQSERGTIFRALAGSLPEEDVAILLKEANGSEFTGREMFETFMMAVNNPSAQDQNWELFQQSWPNLVERTPAFRKPNLARAAGASCDVDKTSQAASFFRSKAEDIPGYERSLAQAVEASNLCAVLKNEKAGELATALKN